MEGSVPLNVFKTNNDLIQLNLSGNHFCDILPNLDNLKNLKKLMAYSNYFSGKIKNMTILKNLEYVNLSQNR